MTNQEILDNAPKGATHVMGGNCYCIENTGDDYSEDGYDYLTFRNEDTSGRHRSLADIAKIAELEREHADFLDDLELGKDVLAIRDLEQQAKGLKDYAKNRCSGMEAVWLIAEAGKLEEQAKQLRGGDV